MAAAKRTAKTGKKSFTPAPELPEIVDGAVRNKVDRWPIYGDENGDDLDRASVITSSETARCARQLQFSKAAGGHAPLEPYTWGYMQRGHSAEAWLVEHLYEFFSMDELRFAGPEQRSFVSKKYPLAGTPDGILVIDGEPILLEVKSIDPRANKRNLPKREHVAQVHQNAGLVNEHGFEVKRAILLYIDASDYAQITQFVIDTDPAEYRMAGKRAKDFFDAIRDDKNAVMEAEGLLPGRADCDFCPFTEECSAVQKRLKEKRGKPAALPEFKSSGRKEALLLSKYVSAKEAADEAKAAADALGDEIRAVCLSRDDRKIQSRSYVASVTEVAGRRSVDTAAIAADYEIDLEKYTKVGKPSTRLKVEPRS